MAMVYATGIDHTASGDRPYSMLTLAIIWRAKNRGQIEVSSGNGFPLKTASRRFHSGRKYVAGQDVHLDGYTQLSHQGFHTTDRVYGEFAE
jgi:hypothetical protein